MHYITGYNFKVIQPQIATATQPYKSVSSANLQNLKSKQTTIEGEFVIGAVYMLYHIKVPRKQTEKFVYTFRSRSNTIKREFTFIDEAEELISKLSGIPLPQKKIKT